MSSEPKVYFSWDDSFQKVKAYVREHGKFPITKDKENGGSWIHVQRMNFKQNILSGQQIAILRTLPPWKVWEANPWKLKFKRVKAYFASNCDKSLLPTDFSFSDWWNDCKGDFKNNILEDERLLLLRTIPQWVEWEKKNIEKTKIQFIPWMESYQRLKAYVDIHNKFPPSRSSVEANWIRSQKERFKAKKLPLEHIQLLEQLSPWNQWKQTPQAQVRQLKQTWDQHYSHLVEYLRVQRKLPLKRERSTVSNWVLQLKKDYRDHLLSQEQLQRLQQLPIWVQWTREFDKKKQKALLKSK